MRKNRFLTLAALFALLFSVQVAYSAGTPTSGASKMEEALEEVDQDAWTTSKATIAVWSCQETLDEVHRSIGNILEQVQADGRVYPSYMDYKTTALTMETKIKCHNQLMMVGVKMGVNVLIEEADGCVILVAGDAEIDKVIGSIVIVDGGVKSRSDKSFVKSSLLATGSRIRFGGTISKSTIYAKNGVKIENGDGLVSYATEKVKVKNLVDPIKFLEGEPLL